MINYSEQIERIKDKILEAKNVDKDYCVFGANKHKYVIYDPILLEDILEIEKKYLIELPHCYKSFLLNIGNGGVGSQNSSLGPFYGIYPFGENLDELIYESTEKYLKNECIIFPKMTDEFWKSLTKNIDDNENLSEEQYLNEIGTLWGGVLPIGSQGGTYLHSIVINGQHKGRIVYLDSGREKPQFAFEKNFLDWYERWLDEVISGELILDNSGWFGYNKSGSESELLITFITSSDIEEKTDCLKGLLNKNKLKEQTINEIERLIEIYPDYRNILIQLICKSDYNQAKPHLIQLIKIDLLSSLQFMRIRG